MAFLPLPLLACCCSSFHVLKTSKTDPRLWVSIITALCLFLKISSTLLRVSNTAGIIWISEDNIIYSYFLLTTDNICYWLVAAGGRAQTSLHLHSDGIKCYCGVNNEGANSLIHLTRQTIEPTHRHPLYFLKNSAPSKQFSYSKTRHLLEHWQFIFYNNKILYLIWTVHSLAESLTYQSPHNFVAMTRVSYGTDNPPVVTIVNCGSNIY